MNKPSGEDLAKRLNLGEVVSFRVHWLYCDLLDLQKDMSRAQFGAGGLLGRSGAADLTCGVFAGFVEKAQAIANAYTQLRWETRVMLGLDYADEVAPLFDHLPKAKEFLQEMEKVKDYLRQKAKDLLDAEATRVHAALDNLSKVGLF